MSKKRKTFTGMDDGKPRENTDYGSVSAGTRAKRIVTDAQIKELRSWYVKDLRRETQASESVRNAWRDTIAIFDELLRRRINGR